MYERINTLVNGISPPRTPPVYVPFLYGTNESGKIAGCLGGAQPCPHRRTYPPRRLRGSGLFPLHPYPAASENRDPPLAIKLAGGAARSRVRVQMFADVCAFPWRRWRSTSWELLGAVHVRGCGCGSLP